MTNSFQKKLGVVLGVPSDGMWCEKFGTSLVGLMTHFMRVPVRGYRTQELRLCSVVGSILPRQRRDCVVMTLNLDYSHLCFIDSDQTFPPNLLHRLLEREVDVVGCNIAIKRIPSAPTARGFDRQPVYTDSDSPPMEKVWSFGCGVVLLRRRVLERIGLKCFEMKWVDAINDYSGEDWAMFDAIRQAGFDLWVDHALSDEVGHVGNFVYTHDVVGTIVNADLKKEEAVVG